MLSILNIRASLLCEVAVAVAALSPAVVCRSAARPLVVETVVVSEVLYGAASGPQPLPPPFPGRHERRHETRRHVLNGTQRTYNIF